MRIQKNQCNCKRETRERDPEEHKFLSWKPLRAKLNDDGVSCVNCDSSTSKLVLVSLLRVIRILFVGNETVVKVTQKREDLLCH